ncbi:MAG: polymer-forming cytoskeletal protein [Anaerolineae bacterium]|nr:polymer-forming cytoskeletal protein [Anaerolineae bacterium]
MFGSRKTQSTPASQQSPASSTTPSNATPPSTQAPRQPIGHETILGANSTFKGDLKSKANVRIDGTFEGSIDIEGNIMVGETAKIVADIHARNMRIAGAIRGNITGNKIELLRTGRVWGDINASAITTEDGAFIDGKITMLGHPAGKQGFAGSLPAPEVSVLMPMSEDIITGEPVEAELIEDDNMAGVNGDKAER